MAWWTEGLLLGPRENYNTDVWIFFLVLFFPLIADASCGTHRIDFYNSLLSKNRLDEALAQVLDDLGLTESDRARFQLNSSNDPDITQVPIPLLKSGKSAACQYIANAHTHTADTRQSREILRAYHSAWEAPASGWVGCSVQGQDLSQPAAAGRRAQECLGEAAIGTWVAAQEIRAFLSQIPVSDSQRL